MKNKYKLKFGNGNPKAQARSDANILRLGRKLTLTIITRQCKADDIVHKCVDYILSDKNIASVSYGTKVVLLQSIGEITLPKLTQKTPIFNMYKSYVDAMVDESDRLQQATFYKIYNALTETDEAMLSSIDYT